MTTEGSGDAPIVRCPSCGTRNRLAPGRIKSGQAPVCGRCQGPLPFDAAPVVVSDSTFAAEVERSPVPVLVDLWAPWCGPCRMIAPALEQIAAEMAGRVRIAKVNVDENPATSARFGVQGIPTLLVFKDGREVDRLVGAHPKAEIARRLARWAA
jgi:thioredoxin 2